MADTHFKGDAGSTYLDILLKQAKEQRSPVFFLGDIVDLWFESFRLADTYRVYFEMVKEFTQSGLGGFFIPGNRDFLAGKVFEKSTGLTVLPEMVDIRIGETPYRLIHGDQIYLGSRNYRIYRVLVRNSFSKNLLRIAPDFILRGLAGLFHREPKMPPDDDKVEMDFKRFEKRIYSKDISTYVCGHIHKNTTVNKTIHDHAITVQTLCSWLTKPEYMNIDESGITIKTLDEHK